MTPTSPNPPSGGLVLSGTVWGVGAGAMLAVNALESQHGAAAALNILLSSTWGALACVGLWRLGARWTLGGRASGALGFSAAVALALGIHLVVDLGLTALLRAPANHAVVGSNRWYMVFVMRLAVETRIFVYLLLYGAFGASALTVLWSIEQRRQERRLIEARMEAVQAQLSALRFQINPHFLFNTLNAINSLIVTQRTAQAERMLTRLADFLRATLAEPTSGLSALEHELSVIEAYLEVEAVRFPDRLRVAYDCPPDLGDVLVPDFILQPLVENAIKHAVAPAERPVTVTLAARAEAGLLVIAVSDDGDLAPGRPVVAPGLGVGLANVRHRLALLFGERAALTVTQDEGGYRATLRFPMARMRAEETP